MNQHALANLASRLPALSLLTDHADREYYGRDWTRRWVPAPLAIALPSSMEEVQEIVCWANRHKVAIVPSGGRTGLSGGAVAAKGELVLSLTRMNRVLSFDAIDRTLTVEPGIALAAVHAKAQEHGLIYPVDFAARGSCSIGGNIATNAGGIRVIRYGNTREWVAGLKVVAGNGELLDLNRALLKNASGYDLRHLMIGSEGTLGIVVEATLRLTSPPPASEVMLLALPDMAALMRVFALFRDRLSLQAFEFFTDVALKHVLAHGVPRAIDGDCPYYVVTEFDAVDERAREVALAVLEQAMEQGLVADGVVAQSQAQAAALWRLREDITESLAPYEPYKNDISVRIGAVPAFLKDIAGLLAREYSEMEVIWFGHIGDGNLHINILKPATLAKEVFIAQCEHVTEILAETLKRHGGSISAEHGIGLVKRAYLKSARGAAEIALMRNIKAVFDPHGILNPGKLFDQG